MLSVLVVNCVCVVDLWVSSKTAVAIAQYATMVLEVVCMSVRFN